MNNKCDGSEYTVLADKRYFAWLLRVWQEHDAAPWRFQLKDVAGKNQYVFDDLPALMDFLAQHVSEDGHIRSGLQS